MECQQLLQPLPAWAVLREEIRWTSFTVDFAKIDLLRPHDLLYPQRMGV